MKEFLSVIKQLEVLVSANKEFIESYLRDVNTPLDERWDIYQELPSFLRNHKTCVQDFLFASEKKAIEVYEIGDFNRNEIVNVAAFFKNYDCDIDDYNENNPDKAIDISLSKEKILQKNLGSFENDW